MLTVIAVAILLFTAGPGEPEERAEPARPAPRPSAAEPVTSTPTIPPEDADALSEMGLTATGGGFSFGSVPGLGGSGWSAGVPSRDLRIAVSSTTPIGTIGYIIPTSREHNYGIVHDIGRSWSLGTRVYGEPGYARVWIQAGYYGTPITCTISVDGKVMDRRTASGPFGQAMCQA